MVVFVVTVKFNIDSIKILFCFILDNRSYSKIENDEDDDMGLQLALKKARKLKQLETLERKPDLAELLVVITLINML